VIEVIVNGTATSLPQHSTVTHLVETLGLPPDGIAVALDRTVVPRSEHPKTALYDGAKVEVIRAVGGG